MTEQQAYHVVAEYPEFELRRYPATWSRRPRSAGPSSWRETWPSRRLARYIGGQNRSSRRMAMTAPVVQEQGGEDRRYVVGFVLPVDVDEADPPDPVDPTVRVRPVPAQTAGVVRFSGRWSRGSFERRKAHLLAALQDADLDVVGPPRYARFDPPWTPWFLRRNEVVVPVAG